MTGAPWPVGELAARGVTLAPHLDVGELCGWAEEMVALRVGTCLSSVQTKAALADFERVRDRSPDAAAVWLAGHAPTSQETVRQVRTMLVLDLAARAEDGAVRESRLDRCPYRDDVAMALWYRGVRPSRPAAQRLLAALSARAGESATVPALGASRQEVIDAARNGELPVAALAEYDQRVTAAWEESRMERLRWWIDEVCRAEWAATRRS